MLDSKLSSINLTSENSKSFFLERFRNPLITTLTTVWYLTFAPDIFAQRVQEVICRKQPIVFGKSTENKPRGLALLADLPPKDQNLNKEGEVWKKSPTKRVSLFENKRKQPRKEERAIDDQEILKRLELTRIDFGSSTLDLIIFNNRNLPDYWRKFIDNQQLFLRVELCKKGCVIKTENFRVATTIFGRQGYPSDETKWYLINTYEQRETEIEIKETTKNAKHQPRSISLQKEKNINRGYFLELYQHQELLSAADRIKKVLDKFLLSKLEAQEILDYYLEITDNDKKVDDKEVVEIAISFIASAGKEHTFRLRLFSLEIDGQSMEMIKVVNGFSNKLVYDSIFKEADIEVIKLHLQHYISDQPLESWQTEKVILNEVTSFVAQMLGHLGKCFVKKEARKNTVFLANGLAITFINKDRANIDVQIRFNGKLLSWSTLTQELGQNYEIKEKALKFVAEKLNSFFNEGITAD